jgi:hypothetical protein
MLAGHLSLMPIGGACGSSGPANAWRLREGKAERWDKHRKVVLSKDNFPNSRAERRPLRKAALGHRAHLGDMGTDSPHPCPEGVA